ncbi:phosphoadenosine phosphosulfate reductase domain-containing protein [Sansalvadorimonas verongulae]|uniref:phosphoadenosine phosphosulfate reductase domain-containing protein n=1 Tax=Sansalvadorimonas verongulae TaxID=2172824 RepID=UPI0012BC8FCB|nr:phosphoadenosine phosphosulfate reductase family protein [Sansalvadorimonas verongulae]MTI11926.1 phosphoadenosine phosphosulfate reductase [Sansalvadorimonas verongulae]
MSNQVDIFSGVSHRLQMTESIEMTAQSMQAYGPDHDHWVITWSGGKDSSATVSLIIYLIDSGKLPSPKRLTVLLADTRMELPPLAIAATQIAEELEERGIEFKRVMAEMDKRFLVYMLGRGVPPPNNGTMRWCTRQIKMDPMEAALEQLCDESGKILTITGVRQGESAIRDNRIMMSCGKDGAECGQGWFQEALPNAKGLKGRISTLAPILHWRVCHVWEWLKHWAPEYEFGDWSTAAIADAYGGDEAEEVNARTGCTACPLAQEDKALNTIIQSPRWTYLKPLLGLSDIYEALRKPENRLRQPAGKTKKDGTLAKGQQRMGPLTMDARLWALDEVCRIQEQVNDQARRINRPEIDILNDEEKVRILELINENTWPDGWDGTEPVASIPHHRMFDDGVTLEDMFVGG